MALHIRKNDVVEVITGDHKGSRGKVLRVDPRKRMVVIEGVNVVFRHVKPTRRNPQGGRIQKEAPIHMSNVLPHDGGKAQRVRFVVEAGRGKAGGVKRRVTKSGTTLHTLTRAERAVKA